MATYTIPTDVTTGTLITASKLNTQVFENIRYLKEERDAHEARMDLQDLTNLLTRPIMTNAYFQVWQRGTPIVHTGAAAYWADQWRGRRGSNAAGTTISRGASGVAGIRNVLRWQRTSGNTATDGMVIAQSVPSELVEGLQGMNMTLLFRIRASSTWTSASNLLSYGVAYDTADDLAPNLTGGTNIVTGNVTLTTSYVFYSVNFTVPADAQSLIVRFQWSPVGTAGTDDWIDLAYVDIRPGSDNTTPALRLSYAEDLAACQRYYQRITSTTASFNHFASGMGTSNTSAVYILSLPVPMRATPTLGYTAADISARRGTTAGSVFNDALSSMAVDVFNGGYNAGISATFSDSRSTTIGQASLLYFEGTGQFIEFSAELT